MRRWISSVVLFFVASASWGNDLNGTRKKLERQYDVSRENGHEPIKNEYELLMLTIRGKLVRISDGIGYTLADDEIGRINTWKNGRRVVIEHPARELLFTARPVVAEFLMCEGLRFAQKFGTVVAEQEGTSLAWFDYERSAEFPVTSLVRTPEWYAILQGHNVNAAKGGILPHTTGFVLDVSRKDMPWKRQEYLRERFLLLQNDGLVIAVEERATNSFHIAVHPEYGANGTCP